VTHKIKKGDGRHIQSERLVGAHCSIAGGLYEAAKRGAEVGCNAIQIFTKNSNQWDSAPLIETEISKFQSACAKHSIKLAFAHAGYLINLASPDEVIYKRSIDSMLVELERAEKLEFPYVVVHPGSHKGIGEAVGVQKVAASIKYLNERTEGFRTRIVLETTAGQGHSIGYDFKHFRDIFAILKDVDLKRVGVCIDTAHIFTAGYELNDRESYSKTMAAFDKYVGLEKLRVIHLNGTSKALGSRVDRHDHLDTGEIKTVAFKLLLNDPRLFSIPVIIETPKGSTIENDRRNIKLIRKFMEGI
jgi:deoxyribonuclease-4